MHGFLIDSICGAKELWSEDEEDDDAKEFVIKNGIFKGDGNGEYFWKEYVKRGDLTLMIVRAFHLNMINKGNFEDVDKKDYYFDAIATAKAHGIAKGDGKHFNPKKYVTIGEAILIIERSIKVANSNVVVDRDFDLDKFYNEKNYNNYATRGLIAEMLEKVFSGNGSVEEDTGLIEYEVGIGDELVTFNDADFKKVFNDLVDDEDKDEKLSYVKFSLPTASKGTLYYDYDTDAKTNEEVEASDKYYVNKSGERLIDDVSFVPEEGFNKALEIEYTAYNSSGDDLYDGLIKITVSGNRNFDLEAINYNMAENKTKTFNDRDFLNVFNKATDNEEIDFIEFKLPEAAMGILYYNVDSNKVFDNDEKVASDNEFELSEIDEIIFVPAKNFTGNAVIEYTAVDKGDDEYTGIVKIKVAEIAVTE